MEAKSRLYAQNEHQVCLRDRVELGGVGLGSPLTVATVEVYRSRGGAANAPFLFPNILTPNFKVGIIAETIGGKTMFVVYLLVEYNVDYYYDGYNTFGQTLAVYATEEIAELARIKIEKENGGKVRSYVVEKYDVQNTIDN